MRSCERLRYMDETGFTPTPKILVWGFTLMELLVVIAIITILAGFVVGASQAARKKGSISKAKAQIAALETSISLYQLDMGDYPASGNANMVKALKDNPGLPEWSGPYMKFQEEELNPQKEYIDSWGKPYVYTKPGVHNTDSYDIYSYGPNNIDDGGAKDDINNW